MALKRFGVSLDEDILTALDEYVSTSGFSNLSQAFRLLIEKNIAEQKWQCNHIVAGTVIIMYDRSRKDIASQIDSIQQQYSDLILSSSQFYLNRDFCLHTATITGEAYRLTALSDRLTAIKGIRHGKLVMGRAD